MPSGPRFNIKMSSYQYRKSHCGDKTVVRSSYLHNGISYTGKMSSLYWIGALKLSYIAFQVSQHVKPLSHQGGVLTATARRARKTQNAELRAVRSPRAPRDRRGIAVASPLDAVGSPRTPCHGAHFVHAQSARRGSAFPRRSEWAPCERRGFAAATQ